MVSRKANPLFFFFFSVIETEEKIKTRKSRNGEQDLNPLWFLKLGRRGIEEILASQLGNGNEAAEFTQKGFNSRKEGESGVESLGLWVL